MKKIVIFIVIFGTLIYGKSGFSYSYLGIEYGDMVGYYGIRSLGMGGTSIASADDYSALFVNPSAMCNFDKKYGVDLSVSEFMGSEKVMDYNTSVGFSSSFSKFKLNSFGVYAKVIDFLALGFGFHPEIDYNYSSEHYIPESTYDKNGTKYIESIGSVDNYSFGISVKIKDYGAIGFSYSILKGSQNIKQGIDYYESAGLPDELSENKYDISGGKLNLGFLASVTRTISIGGFLKTGNSLDRTEDSSTTSIEIPSQYGAGVLFKSLFGYDTDFAFDLVYKNWEDFKVTPQNQDAYTSSGFHNTYELHTGVEHILSFGKTKVPIRLGYYFQPFYGNDAYDKSVFTFGTGIWGYPLAELKIDFGFEFGKRNYLGDNAYFDNTKFIDETLANFILGVKYEIK